MLETCYCNMVPCNGQHRSYMVLAETYKSLSLKPVYLSACAWNVLTTTSDALRGFSAAHHRFHIQANCHKNKVHNLSLTPDNITSPDSVRAASLESTNRTEFFISSSSSSLQSGLLAPTAKTTELMNLGGMFETNSNRILSKRHMWTNNRHYCANAIHKQSDVSTGDMLNDRTTKK